MLKHFKGFKQYYPTADDRPDYADLIEAGVGFEMDEDGRDWYDLRETFDADTFKVVYGADGVVVQCETDTNELCPHGMAGVVELTDVPEGLRRDTTFMYRFNGVDVELDPKYFEGLKARYMRFAGAKIAEYRDLLDMGADVGDILQKWRGYRLDVFNVDTSLMMDIEWPSAPE